jgi:type I restriction enzyme S subunit
MSRWPTKALADLCEITIGKTPPRNVPRYWGDGYAWLSIADMGQGRVLQHTKETITPTAVDEGVSGRLVPPGTVLLSFKLSIGKLGIAAVPLYTNEAIAALAIRDVGKLSPEYLLRALAAADLQAGTDRAVMGRTLNKAKLQRLRIPLPALPEQRRIAAILDTADAVRCKRQQTLDLADQFLRSAFLDMFGDPVTNPKGWPLKPLGHIATITTGNTPSRTKPEYYGAGTEWIKSDNINTPDHYVTLASERLSEEGRVVGRIAHPGATLMTCIAGSRSCIGNVAMADREVAFNQQINALEPSAMVLPEFLYFDLLLAKRLIQTASTDSMKGLVSKGRLARLELPVPPAAMQVQFSGLFRTAMATGRLLEASIEGCDALFKSLVQRAFRGQLMSTTHGPTPVQEVRHEATRL